MELVLNPAKQLFVLKDKRGIQLCIFLHLKPLFSGEVFLFVLVTQINQRGRIR